SRTTRSAAPPEHRCSTPSCCRPKGVSRSGIVRRPLGRGEPEPLPLASARSRRGGLDVRRHGRSHAGLPHPADRARVLARRVVLFASFWAYGTLLAGGVAITVLPNFGWRWAFAIGALPALYVAYLRRALPESPRYLAEKGRAPEADAIVRRVERAGGGALLTL